MAKVVEALIAKGRRVHLPKEQREVAFGIADLSTHKEMHQRIIKKGGIKTLLHLLTVSSDIETQRFTAFALANTSSCETYRFDIARHKDCLSCLIGYIGTEDADLVGRQYCAMALGNLAAEVDNQSDIVSLGGIESLTLLLKRCHIDTEVESASYAAFALSNLAANTDYRKQIVDIGAVEDLIALACTEDLNIQRRALGVLRGICITYEYRSPVVQLGILDPLVIMSRSDNIQILREVSAAMNCLSSVPENKLEIANRSLSTIVSLLLAEDMEVERHACCTIANLAEVPEVHERLIQENGLPPLVARFASQDLNCKGEAARAIANLSSNTESQKHLVQRKTLDDIVDALDKEEVNCQRFASLCLANFATNSTSQQKIVEAGAIPPLISLVYNQDTQLEARRYACLALANLSSTKEYHPLILRNRALEAFFVLSISPDVMSQYYVVCALANLSSNIDNHKLIIEEGGIQPIVTLVYASDPDVHLQASAALRGLSVSHDIKMKIVQEGGLEPLSRLLLSKEVQILREAIGCLCNLSQGDENKMEMSKCGIITPLITHMQSEDMEIARYSCATLANLAEMPENQELIHLEGCVVPCISVMRSQYLEVQQESGRLLANLCANESGGTSECILESGGTQILMSFLLSRDSTLQRVGAFGIGNLCTHEKHRVALVGAGVLEPLSTLSRAKEVDLEIQRFALVSLVNLATEVKNHTALIEQNILSLLISLSNSSDTEVRMYAAAAVSKIAQNIDLRDVVTDEGGLEPILFLTGIDDIEVRQTILPAITALSFVDSNKESICRNGGLQCILHLLVDTNIDEEVLRLSCCTIANLSESMVNMISIVDAGMIPLLIKAFDSKSELIQTEVARALGNLSTNVDYGATILEYDILHSLINLLVKPATHDCQRMAVMLLANLTTNIRLHAQIIDSGILDSIIAALRMSLDPKYTSDHETTRFFLMLLANLSCNIEYHQMIVEFDVIDLIIKFTGHRDIKTRQHAIFTLGNLCTNQEVLKKIVEARGLSKLISFSFPPADTDSTNSQFQAISGIRGISVNKSFREKLVEMGCIEPLVLATKSNDVEIQREATASLCNLALSMNNKFKMVQDGVVASLLSMLTSDDSTCQVFAIGAIANLAEKGSDVQHRLLDDNCLQPLIRIIESRDIVVEARKEVARCFALFSSNNDIHNYLMKRKVLIALSDLMRKGEDPLCNRFSTLAIANLALSFDNHESLLKLDILLLLNDLSASDDVLTRRCVAFAFHNICINSKNHRKCEKQGVASSLATLLVHDDMRTKFHTCLAAKYFAISVKGRAQFVECNGLQPLLDFGKIEDVESRRETAAALRNLSLSDKNKVLIIKEGGMNILVEYCRSQDEELSHQACGVLANLAESSANQLMMVHGGILHHLKFAMMLDSTTVMRESVRAIANLTSDLTCNSLIAGAGTLIPLLRALKSEDVMSRRFATLAISNLTTNRDNLNKVVQDGGIAPLLALACDSSAENIFVRRYAHFAITNISASHKHHDELMVNQIIDLSISCLEHSDQDLRISSSLCLSNLCSNPLNHHDLSEASIINHLIPLLMDSDRLVVLRSISSLRGLSTNEQLRNIMVYKGVLNSLLQYTRSDDIDIQVETLATLCNLSLGGYIGANADQFLRTVELNYLISFLCSTDSTYRLFGSVSIGNIASNEIFHDNLIRSGTISTLISIASIADTESKRCISYALCNLCASGINRVIVVNEGGLIPIFSLSYSTDEMDKIAALSTLRGLCSCLDITRDIVVAGGLDIIRLALSRYNSVECRREAIEALCGLSVNDENKASITKSGILKCLLPLVTNSEMFISSVALRVFANCSENIDLQIDIVDHIRGNFLIHVVSTGVIENMRELSRFYTNLSGNVSTHKYLREYGIHKTNIDFCFGDDVNITCYALIFLINFTIEATNHEFLFDHKSDLVEILSKSMRGECWNGEVKLSRYSCLLFGALIQSDLFFDAMLEPKILDGIKRCLTSEDDETCFNASYAVHKLSMRLDLLSELGKYSIERETLRFIFSYSKSTKLCHAISALRYLSLDNDISLKIAQNDGFSILSKECNTGSTEIKREIAATLCHLTLNDENKIAILSKNAAVETIIGLCGFPDIETSRFALGAIANITESPPSHELLVFEFHILKVLLTKMTNKNLCLKREATRCVANLLSSKKVQDVFFEFSGLNVLHNASRTSDLECQYNAALSYHKLASHIDSHDTMIVNDSIRMILRLIGSDRTTASAQQAAAALRALATNETVRLSLLEEGAMQEGIKLLSEKPIAFQTIIAGFLSNLSKSSRLKGSLLENGIINQLNNCILNSDDTELLFQCAGILSNLSEHQKNSSLFWCDETILALLKLGECDIRTQSLMTRTFGFLSADAEKSLNDGMDDKILKALIRLMSSEDVRVASNAANVLGNMAKEESKQIMLQKLGALHPLVNLLKSDSCECLASSCRTLSLLLLPQENKKHFFQFTEGLTDLIKLSWSEAEEVNCYVARVLCNLSTYSNIHERILLLGGIEALIQLIGLSQIETVRSAMKALCNLCGTKYIQDYVLNCVGIMKIIPFLSSTDLFCKEFTIMILSNLSSNDESGEGIITSGVLQTISSLDVDKLSTVITKAVGLILYNLSVSVDSHIHLVEAAAPKILVKMMKNSCHECRRYGVMTFCNLSANAVTRRNTIKEGGLQSCISMLKDSDHLCKFFSCICLANMANDENTQIQVVVHGALSVLTKFISDVDKLLQRSALMCLCNLARNHTNHAPFFRQSILENILSLNQEVTDGDLQSYSTFTIANLTSNDDVLDAIGSGGGLKPLIDMTYSDDIHLKFISISALRRLTSSAQNRELVFSGNILDILKNELQSFGVEIQKEIAGLICNLSLHIPCRLFIAQYHLDSIKILLSAQNSEIIYFVLGTLANIAEHIDNHIAITETGLPVTICQFLLYNDEDVRREASRAVCNLLSSPEIHDCIISSGLSALLELMETSDHECQYTVILSCRKLVVNLHSHYIMIGQGLRSLVKLLKVNSFSVSRHAGEILRDLSACVENQLNFFSEEIIKELIKIMKEGNDTLQTIIVAILRHLSTNQKLKRAIMTSGIIVYVIQSIRSATDDLLHQVAGLLANLSELDENKIGLVENGVTSALIILARSELTEILQDVSRTMANICSNEESHKVIVRQGAMTCLMALKKAQDPVTERYVSISLQFLVSNSEIRKSLVKNDYLLQVISLAYHSSMEYKESIASSFRFLTMEEEMKSNFVEAGGLNAIAQLSKEDDLEIRRNICFAAANLSISCDLHKEILNAGCVEIMKELCDTSSDMKIVREICRFFSFLSVSEEAKGSIINSGVVPFIVKYTRRTDITTLRYAVLTLCNVCSSVHHKEYVVREEGLVKTLIYLARYPDLIIERSAVLAIASLSLCVTDELKVFITSHGTLRPLLELIGYPDLELQQCASIALNCLLLGDCMSIKSELMNTPSGLTSILSLHETEDDECLHNAIYLVGSAMECYDARKVFMSKGCIEIVVNRLKLSSCPIEVKRAAGYFFSVISEDEDNHSHLHRVGALEEVVKLAGLVDIECQTYGAFCLAFLANNSDFQVPLVKMGAVRPLVTMMATESSSKHYAGLALLKLAANFENHITIAEEGGIQALLQLGRSRIANEEVNYKAALTIGHMASKAVEGSIEASKQKEGIGYAAASYSKKRSQSKVVGNKEKSENK